MSTRNENTDVNELGRSPDAQEERQQQLIDLLRQTAPELLSDNQVDVERLKELLGEERLAPAEHYELNWAGKKDARREIQKKTSHTLRPDANNPESAQHMLIEGENLEVLRVLQKSYYGKVKMIYIDPPYNTGNDSFVYPDDYSETLEEYQKRTGEKNEAGFLNKQSLWKKNSKESGQYHSAWLSMMYPRLYLARNLLREDGVIFISIDDNEAANLKLLCDEVFGEENFVSQFVWNTEGHTDNQYDVKVNHEYVLLYSKSAAGYVGHVVDPNTREESNLWRGFAENSITKNGSANPPSEVLLPKGFPCKGDKINLDSNSPSKKYFEQVYSIGYVTRELTREYGVTYPIRLEEMKVQEGMLTAPCRVFSGWANVEKLRLFIKGGCKPIDEGDGNTLTFYLSERGVIYYRRDREKARNILSVIRNVGTTEQMRSELERLGVPFQYPKPKQLLNYLIKIGVETGGYVLDFFAGSCTTAQAVMELNAEDGGNRQSISVQLPEKIEENSEADKAGYRTVADITRARIEKVIAKLKAEQPEQTTELACANFTLSPSNFKVWNSELNDLGAIRQQLDALQNTEKDADQQTAMLTELLLKNGLGALGVHAVSKARKLACGVTVHRVLREDDRYLWLYFEPYVAALRDEILSASPAQVIMLNSCFGGSQGDEQLSNLQLELAARDISLLVI